MAGRGMVVVAVVYISDSLFTMKLIWQVISLAVSTWCWAIKIVVGVLPPSLPNILLAGTSQSGLKGGAVVPQTGGTRGLQHPPWSRGE